MLRAVLVALLTASSAARASPLEPLWEAKAPCNRWSVSAWGDVLVMRVRDRLVTLDRVTGVPGAPIALASPPPLFTDHSVWTELEWVNQAVGDAVLLHGGTWFAVHDRTGRPVWHTAPGVDGAGEPIVRAVGRDVLVGSPLPGDAGLRVELVDGRTGAARWRAHARPEEVRLAGLADDGARIYAITSGGFYDDRVAVTAFERATGKRLWRIDVATGQSGGVITPLPTQHFATAAGQLFSALPSGVTAYDGATGRATRLTSAGTTAYFRAIAARGTRIYVAREAAVTAIDATTHRELWAAALHDTVLVAATDDAVYVTDPETMLHALDARTGAELASYGIAEREPAYAAEDGRSPVYVACKDDRLTAFGPAQTTQPVEQATITGRLLCRGCGKHGQATPFANIEVTGGGATTRTDATGAFSFAVAARGTLRVLFELPDVPPPFTSWSENGRFVVLRGKHRYDLGVIGPRRRGAGDLP